MTKDSSENRIYEAEQLEGKAIANIKIPSWAAIDNIKYHKNCLFDENDRYKYLESGDITPLLQTDEMIAFYRVINVEQKRGNDRLLWDDGKNYSFIFHHVELIK